jgi:SlyX protein
MEERIVELEVRVAYQDKLLADLDEVVRSFAARVEALERKVKELEETSAPQAGPADETPPHY